MTIYVKFVFSILCDIAFQFYRTFGKKVSEVFEVFVKKKRHYACEIHKHTSVLPLKCVQMCANACKCVCNVIDAISMTCCSYVIPSRLLFH